MRRSAQVFLLVALAACVVILARGFAEPKKPWRLENRIPASSLGLLAVEDLDGWKKRLEKTAMSQLLRHPEMEAFLEPLRTSAERWLKDRRGPMSDAPPEIWEVLEQLTGVTGQAAVALLDVDMEAEVPKVVASLDFGPNVDDLKQFLERLHEKLDPDAETVRSFEKEGRTWWQVKAEPPIAATTFDSTFVVATDAELLERVIKHDGADVLGGTQDYQAVRKLTGAGDLGVFAYGNVPAVVELFEPHMDAEETRIANALGLDTVRAVGYGMAFAGDGFLDSLVVHAPGADHGLFTMLTMKPYTGAALPHVPADAFYYTESALADWGALLPNVRSLMAQVDREAVHDLDEFLEHWNASVGVDLEKELIAGLAGGTCYYATLPEGGGVYPEFAVMLEVKDPKAYGAVFQRFADGLAGAISEEGHVVASTRSIPYRDHTLHLFEMVDSGRGVVPFTPTWAFRGNWLVLTLVPYTMKDLLTRPDAVGRLGDEEDFKALRASMPAGASSFEYTDLQALMLLVYGTAVPALQTALKPNMLGEAGERLKLDWALLPPARELKPYFRSLGVFSRLDRDGLLLSMHAPIPMGALVAAGAAAFSLGFAYTARAMPPHAIAADAPMQRSPSARARLDAQNLARFVFRFLHEHKRLPKSLDELVEKDIMPALPLDPWGRDYVLRVVDVKRNRFQVVSPGPDGRADTLDDVVAGG